MTCWRAIRANRLAIPPSCWMRCTALRVAVTMFDAGGRLSFANAHLNHFFRGLPPYPELIGRTYEEIIRLELPEIAPAALKDGVEAFIDLRLGQLGAARLGAAGCGAGRRPHPRDQGAARRPWRCHPAVERRHPGAAPIRPAGRSDPAFRRRLSPSTTPGTISSPATNSMPSSPASRWWRCAASPSRTSSAKSCTAAGWRSTCTPEEWMARRLRGHRQQRSADTLQTADGKAFLVRDCATPDGGRAVVFTDITEKTRAEDALAQTQRALEHTRDEAAAPDRLSFRSHQAARSGLGPGRQRQDHASAHHEP